MMYVKIKRLTATAIIPTKGTQRSGGYDLYADTNIDVVIPPGQTVSLFTGIALEIPSGYAGFVYSRSGAAVKRGLCIATGVSVIDADYRGNIGIPIRNESNETQVISPHERIAQIVFHPVADVKFNEVDGDLSQTERGTGGFGSTGK